MSVIITIGDESKSIDDHYESWISEQVRNRRKAGESVSVKVEISSGLDLVFACYDTPRGGGGTSRTYTPRQSEVIKLWEQHNLYDCPFEPGNLVSFLKRLKKFL